MVRNKQGSWDFPDKSQAISSMLNVEPRINEIADVSVEYVDNIDSVDFEPKHWNLISKKIIENYDDYDGFVITHGTDTMAYTSSALSFSLQDLG